MITEHYNMQILEGINYVSKSDWIFGKESDTRRDHRWVASLS